MDVVHVDHLEELVALAAWVQRLSSSEHDGGESTACAWAEVHGALAFIDDRAARIAAQRAGLDVHGTAWVIAQAVNYGQQTPSGTTALLDTLILDGSPRPVSHRPCHNSTLGYSADRTRPSAPRRT
jgi:predicted nucleic acid-binding protein